MKFSGGILTSDCEEKIVLSNGLLNANIYLKIIDVVQYLKTDMSIILLIP
jgi:hypothetical protein